MNRNAHVRKTPDGWVASLAGGSQTSPFETWLEAFQYAESHTAMFRDYWWRDGEPCS